ncbi:hypothetical protein IMX26_06070 [Clostridium sp. 'deep sea']|uniref:FtsX-like permease family protein n=1 Tax=Clostridium sp. 'deep sea' TaxID=2779445 RepID=UPI00189659A8|nr:ABC transporter permease [Clostridium sp. 'deep sea']QOR36378.1 hypothetical protein IMX26_06070 [Clostridium sp. 'deep sea']
MMFKLSFRNAIRSFKDYMVYFLTLVFVISLYYVFASISYQPFIQSLSPEAVKEIISLLGRVNLVLIAVVTGFVFYANNFLLKRRGKELGVYMTIGISPIKINIMLFLEAIFIGVIAIFIGVAFGISLTTLIGLLIVKMLGLNHIASPFVLESSSIINTAKVFICIFIGSALLNYFRIVRLKVVNLLNSFGKQKKIQKTHKAIFVISVIVFILSVCVMLYSYNTFINYGIDFGQSFILNSVYFLAIGFVAFIASGTYILSFIADRNKNMVYKNINIFTFKKMTDNIVNNSLVIGTIALIMSITLVAVGMGFSYKSWLNESLLAEAPYSISVSSLTTDQKIGDFLPYFNNKGYEVKNALEFKVYVTDIQQNEVVDNFLIIRDIDKYDLKSNLSYIKLSDYNKILDIIGKKNIVLKNNEVAINSSSTFYNAVKSYFKKHKSLNLNNTIVNTSINRVYDYKISDAFYVTGSNINLIVPDNFVPNKQPKVLKSFIINTNTDLSIKDVKEFRDYMFSKTGGFTMSSQSEQMEYKLKNATYKIVASLFLGMILMVIGLSILSLHQMTDSIESRKNYSILSHLGVSNMALKMSLLKQICFYFLIPLAIAIPNFIVAMKVIATWFGIAGSFSVSVAFLTTFGVILAIYVLFIMLTYCSCRMILNLS